MKKQVRKLEEEFDEGVISKTEKLSDVSGTNDKKALEKEFEEIMMRNDNRSLVRIIEGSTNKITGAMTNNFINVDVEHFTKNFEKLKTIRLACHLFIVSLYNHCCVLLWRNHYVSSKDENFKKQ